MRFPKWPHRGPFPQRLSGRSPATSALSPNDHLTGNASVAVANHSRVQCQLPVHIDEHVKTSPTRPSRSFGDRPARAHNKSGPAVHIAPHAPPQVASGHVRGSVKGICSCLILGPLRETLTIWGPRLRSRRTISPSPCSFALTFEGRQARLERRPAGDADLVAGRLVNSWTSGLEYGAGHLLPQLPDLHARGSSARQANAS